MLIVTDVRNMMVHESRWGADNIYRCHRNQKELFQLEETALAYLTDTGAHRDPICHQT